jgi:hypothetical protein
MAINNAIGDVIVNKSLIILSSNIDKSNDFNSIPKKDAEIPIS